MWKASGGVNRTCIGALSPFISLVVKACGDNSGETVLAVIPMRRMPDKNKPSPLEADYNQGGHIDEQTPAC